MEKYISVTKVLSVFFMLFLIGCNANSNTYHEITSKIDEEKTKKNSNRQINWKNLFATEKGRALLFFGFYAIFFPPQNLPFSPNFAYRTLM